MEGELCIAAAPYIQGPCPDGSFSNIPVQSPTGHYGVTTILSPVCIPTGSRFSIPHTIIQLSYCPGSPQPISFQPETLPNQYLMYNAALQAPGGYIHKFIHVVGYTSRFRPR